MKNECVFYLNEEGSCSWASMYHDSDSEDCRLQFDDLNACQQEAERQNERPEIADMRTAEHKINIALAVHLERHHGIPLVEAERQEEISQQLERAHELAVDALEGEGRKEKMRSVSYVCEFYGKNHPYKCIRKGHANCNAMQSIESGSSGNKRCKDERTGSPDRRVNKQPTLASFGYPQVSEHSYDERDRRKSRGLRSGD